jgi:acyl carrier protein
MNGQSVTVSPSDSRLPGRAAKTGSPGLSAAIVEQALSEELRKNLSAQPLDVTANLADLGLSSVDFVQLLAFLQTKFSCQLTLNELWTAGTVRAIGLLVSKQGAVRTDAAVERRALPKGMPAGRWIAAPQQRRFWRVHRPTETRFSEVVTAVLPLPSGMDAAIVRQSIARVCDLHDSLRTIFSFESQELWAVDRNCSFEFEELELGAIPSRCGLSGVLQSEAGRIYDVVNGPTMRCQFVKGASEGDFLIVNAYHLVCDGASKQILARHLEASLEAGTRGAEPAFAAPGWSYARYCEWSNWLRTQPAFETARSYWRSTFSSDFDPFHLSDRRQSVLDATAYSYVFRLDGSASRAVGDFAQK